MFTGRRLHATLSIARPIRRRFYASRVLIPTIGPYHPPAGAWSKSAIQPSSRARRWGDSGPTRCSTDTTGSPPGASVRAFPCRAPWWHPGSLHQGRRRRSPEIRWGCKGNGTSPGGRWLAADLPRQAAVRGPCDRRRRTQRHAAGLDPGGGTSARQAPLIGSGPDLALLPHLRGKPLATKLRPEPGAPPSDSERGRRGSFTPIATAGRGVNKDAVAAPSPQSTRSRYRKASRPLQVKRPGSQTDSNALTVPRHRVARNGPHAARSALVLSSYVSIGRRVLRPDRGYCPQSTHIFPGV